MRHMPILSVSLDRNESVLVRMLQVLLLFEMHLHNFGPISIVDLCVASDVTDWAQLQDLVKIYHNNSLVLETIWAV